MKIFDYRLSGNEMKVYLYLARIQNDSEITMAKRETIRMRCGLRSNTTVGSILHVLEQKGLISKFHRYAANGYYISSMYLLKPLVGKWFAFYVDDMCIRDRCCPQWAEANSWYICIFLCFGEKTGKHGRPCAKWKGPQGWPAARCAKQFAIWKKLLYC